MSKAIDVKGEKTNMDFTSDFDTCIFLGLWASKILLQALKYHFIANEDLLRTLLVHTSSFPLKDLNKCQLLSVPIHHIRCLTASSFNERHQYSWSRDRSSLPFLAHSPH
jgi:hypothetical protein